MVKFLNTNIFLKNFQPTATKTNLVDDDSRHSLPISQMGNYQVLLTPHILTIAINGKYL